MVAGLEATPPPWTLSVSLLKEVRVTLHAADGRSYRVPISPNSKRIQLLAYLAWRGGQNTSRGKILMDVFRPDLLKERGLSNKEFWHLWRHSSKERRRLNQELGSKFDAHKQLLRRDIRVAVMQLNAEQGAVPLLTNLDPFEQDGSGWDRNWRLSSLWQVDLETIEAQARVVQEAEKWNQLTKTGPELVKAACDAVLAAYPGDFLEEMIRAYPEEFRPWKTCWACEPYTLYRDYYLKALWRAGEYEWQKGRANADGNPWEHFERAAELFRRHAFYACNSRLDPGVSFRAEGEWPTFRVFTSEEAMCRSLSVYQAEGRVQDFEECKQTYVRHMERISRGTWNPGKELREIMQQAATGQDRADGAPPASPA